MTVSCDLLAVETCCEMSFDYGLAHQIVAFSAVAADESQAPGGETVPRERLGEARQTRGKNPAAATPDAVARNSRRFISNPS